MASRLSKVSFGEDLLPLVKGFDCGPDEWDREVAEWIQQPSGSGGALDELRSSDQLRVWLHFDSATQLVGYSSLGQTNWPQMLKLSIIPNVAVAKDHQGHGYFREIMGHLIDAAQKEAQRPESPRLPIIVLYVDPRNTKAITIYRKYNFQTTTRNYTDRVTGKVYEGMLLRIG